VEAVVLVLEREPVAGGLGPVDDDTRRLRRLGEPGRVRQEVRQGVPQLVEPLAAIGGDREDGQARLAHRTDAPGGAGQLGLFTPAERRVVDELKTLEVERLTPIEALNALARVVGRLKQGGD